MAVFNEPTKWQTSLVNSGDANTIPQTTPAGTGEASFEDGFPQITQVPIGAGGIAPDRKDFNGLFKVLGDWIFFLQNGGLSTYSANFDYVVGRVVIYNNNIYKCIQVNGVSSTVVAPDSVSPLGSDYWKQLDADNNNTALITGQTIVSEIPLTDAKLHLKDGALLSGSGVYADFVDFIEELYNGGTASSSFCTEAEWQTSNTNYGFCNKFVYDSVANTVRLPKVNSEHGALIKSYSSGSDWYRIYQDGWCEQGGQFYKTSGSTQQYDLLVSFIDTNYHIDFQVYHTGTVTYVDVLYGKTNDKFTIISSNNNCNYLWFACGYADISDLQTAPIYEYIVVGTVSKTQIQIDIDNVMADLANKADKEFSNVTNPVQAFKDMSIGWGRPDYSAGISITISSSNPYTAPSDGWIIGSFNINGTGSADMFINGSYVGPDNNGGQTTTVPVTKNDIVSISSGSQDTGLYFYPCKGAN